MTAKFIVIEGLEGAGKSTAIKAVNNYLNQAGVSDVILTREPGGTDVAEQLRNIIKGNSCDEIIFKETELLLMYAARVQLLNHVIIPALANNSWVIADRFELSSFAYQGAGRGIDQQLLHALSTHCVKNLKPDLTLYLDINPVLGLERVVTRGAKDRIEAESLVFFERIRQCYLQAVSSDDNAVLIDASQTMDAVKQDIIAVLKQRVACGA